MRMTSTEEVGTIYSLFANEFGAVCEIATPGSTIYLGSRDSKMGRRWFIQGDEGVILWNASAESTLMLCERWLEHNGYQQQGKLPPEVFEFRK